MQTSWKEEKEGKRAKGNEKSHFKSGYIATFQSPIRKSHKPSKERRKGGPFKRKKYIERN